MTKHQLIESWVEINDIELMSDEIKKEELREYVKHQLANQLADTILDNGFGEITETNNPIIMSTKFRYSLVVINPDDYKELHHAITRNDFKILKDGEPIPLVDLL